MAETSGFFDAVYDETTGEYDLEYLSSQFAEYFSKFIKNGVFASPTNQLKVIFVNSLSVKVLEGSAYINGYWYKNDSDLVLSVPPNLGSSSRTDSVLCRWDANNRQISVIYQTGSTAVTRTEQYYDLKLAEIIVPSGSSISQADITDTRTDESVCGFVTCLLRVESTEDLFAQYDSMFNTWFDEVKDQVTGDLAIRLQTEFDELNEAVDDYQDAVEADILQYRNDIQSDISTYEGNIAQQISGYNTNYQQTLNAANTAAQEANTTAQAANQTISNFVAADFVLPLQNLTFTNKRCVINDSRVTASSLIDVYFTEDTMIVAETARIYVDSDSGQIILTAETQPASTLKARIRVRVM